ncbi:MAG: hypothetical protein PHP14_03285 [Candidatus Pacebacteria bacterium]|jgi:hypothetical protein|nr:hypothetical protein [Candidatus Paceibacterota bacterium]
MSKKQKDDLDNIDIIGDSGDDLSDVKDQLKKLKKQSEDLDEDVVMDSDDPDPVANEDIIINEENTIPFNDENRYYKSYEKFLKDQPEE